MSEPIWIECEGSNLVGHAVMGDGQPLVMCQMCGQTYIPVGAYGSVPEHDRIAQTRRRSPADPVIAWIGGTAVVHGERDDSEMCLCGFPEYFACPDWIAGNGTVSSLIFTATPDSFYVNSPERCWAEDDVADSCTDDADWTWPR